MSACSSNCRIKSFFIVLLSMKFNNGKNVFLYRNSGILGSVFEPNLVEFPLGFIGLNLNKQDNEEIITVSEAEVFAISKIAQSKRATCHYTRILTKENNFKFSNRVYKQRCSNQKRERYIACGFFSWHACAVHRCKYFYLALWVRTSIQFFWTFLFGERYICGVWSLCIFSSNNQTFSLFLSLSRFFVVVSFLLTVQIMQK